MIRESVRIDGGSDEIEPLNGQLLYLQSQNVEENEKSQQNGETMSCGLCHGLLVVYVRGDLLARAGIQHGCRERTGGHAKSPIKNSQIYIIHSSVCTPM